MRPHLLPVLPLRAWCTLSLASLPASAQDSAVPSSGGSERELPATVVSGKPESPYVSPELSAGSRLGLPPREQVNVINTVTRPSMEDRGASSISEALEFTQGVRVVSPAYTSGSLGIRSRGFEAFDTFVNGLRVGAFGVTFDGASIERLEVLKGPAGVQYGLAEPGGTLNVVTKRPVADPLLRLRGQAGSFDFYRAELDLGGAIPGTDDRILTRFNFAAENGGGFREFDESRRVAFTPAVQFRLTETTTLDLELTYNRDEFLFNRGLTPHPYILELPFERSLMAPDLPLSTSDNLAAFSTLVHAFGESGWKARQRFGYFSTRGTNHEINLLVNDVDASGNIERSYKNSFRDNTFWTLQHELEASFATGPVAHKALVGFEVSHTDFGYGFFDPASPAQDIGSLNVFRPVHRGYAYPDRSELVERFPAERYGNDILATYFDYQLKPWEKLKILGGARFDWTTGYYETIDGSVDYGAGDAFGFSPRVGAVFTPVAPLDLFANYTTGFSPNMFALDADGNYLANPDPETGEQYEAGFRFELVPDKLRAGFAAFSLAKQNVAVPDPADPTGTRSILTGEQRSDGVEFDLTGNILPGWDVALGYAYMDARTTSDSDPSQVGLPLVDAPENHVTLWTRYQIQDGPLRGVWGGYGFTYVDDRRSSFANAGFTLPSYVRHDLGVGYTRDSWTAQLNLQNLGDERIYFTHGNNIHLQPPFGLRLSITREF
jgi:iron complex outermembrane receptor protein